MLRNLLVLILGIIPASVLAQQQFLGHGKIEFERKINVHKQIDPDENSDWYKDFVSKQPRFYGTEILMKNFKNPSDAEVRRDFPGGFPGDGVNKFIASGRTDQENDAFNYVKRFANFRKTSSALKTGNFMQFLPEDGVYVYFRYDNNETVMCVFNQNDQARTINLSRFSERIKDNTRAYDVATGVTFNLEPSLTLGGKYVLVMKLSR